MIAIDQQETLRIVSNTLGILSLFNHGWHRGDVQQQPTICQPGLSITNNCEPTVGDT